MTSTVLARFGSFKRDLVGKVEGLKPRYFCDISDFNRLWERVKVTFCSTEGTFSVFAASGHG